MTSRRNFIAFAAVASIAEILGVAKVLAATDHLVRTDAEWRKLLSPAQYRVLRQAGTEYPFTSPLLNEHREGVFGCAGCELPAVFLEDEIRQRHGLAELLGASGRRRSERPRTIRSA